MTVDLIITDGMVVTPDGSFRASIAVDDGKIVSIGTASQSPKAEKTIEASGLLVLPGAIDPHVHFRDPGFEYKEDFHSGTLAAAFGGVTTIMDMPNTLPPVIDVQAFRKKKSVVSQKSMVDFCLLAGVGPSTVENVGPLANAGAVYFKTLMGGYEPEKNTTERDMMTFDEGGLLTVFTAVAKTGRVISIHAESQELWRYFLDKMKRQGRNDVAAYAQSRPNIVESAAVSRAILIANQAKCRLHIVHTSAKESVELVMQARAKGQSVTFETCPHYLFFTSRDLAPMGPTGLMNPPVRSEVDKKALWEGVQNSEFDIVGTDHAPHADSEKRRGLKSVWETAPGIVGVETFLPLMMTEALRGRITLQQVVSLTSQNAAKLFGIYPRKGAIAIGSDADLVIVDPKREKRISKKDLHSKSKSTPFIGWEVKGIPVITLVRGQVVVDHGEVMAKPGLGMFVSPSVERASAPKRN
jgi:allantoinase